MKLVGDVVAKCLNRPRKRAELIQECYLSLQHLLGKLARQELRTVELERLFQSGEDKIELTRSFVDSDTEKLEYVGSKVNGLYEGLGKLINPRPAAQAVTLKEAGALAREGFECYKGQFREGKRHGLGTVYFKDGARLEGNFVADEVQGVGTFQDAQGRRVLGRWLRGQLQE
jgi:hypothetical protein